MDILIPEVGLVFWTSIAFLLLVFTLSKFAWRPIIDTLRIREESISEALQAAEYAREEISNLKINNEKLLIKAREERELLLQEAGKATITIKENAKNEAGIIAKRMIESAKVEIETKKQLALKQVHNQVANLSIEIAEKIIRKNIANDEAQKMLVEELLNAKLSTN